MRRRRRSQSNSNSDEHTYRFHGSTWGEGSLLALCNCLAVSSSPQVIEKIPRKWRPASTRRVKSQRTPRYLLSAAEKRRGNGGGCSLRQSLYQALQSCLPNWIEAGHRSRVQKVAGERKRSRRDRNARPHAAEPQQLRLCADRLRILGRQFLGHQFLEPWQPIRARGLPESEKQVRLPRQRVGRRNRFLRRATRVRGAPSLTRARRGGVWGGESPAFFPTGHAKARHTSSIRSEPEILGPEDKCGAEFCWRNRQLSRWHRYQHRR